jgi:hypothetical protein
MQEFWNDKRYQQSNQHWQDKNQNHYYSFPLEVIFHEWPHINLNSWRFVRELSG